MDYDEERHYADDLLDALLERLVDPLLYDLSRKQYPDHGTQLVAKQMEAAAWLYYFYLHKLFPAMEYYDPSELCHKAVLLRLGLLNYVKEAAQTVPCAVKTRVQTTMSAATACAAGVDKISRVAILLLRKDWKTCLIVKSLITRGLWSFVEGEVEDGADCLQCAYSALLENVGIEKCSVQIENKYYHFRAMSQADQNTRLYIMVCDEHVQVKPCSDIEECQWMLLDDLLVKANDDFISVSGWGMNASPAIDYLHIYPAVDSLRQLLRRDDGESKADCGKYQEQTSDAAVSQTIELGDDEDVFVDLMTRNCLETKGRKRVHDDSQQEQRCDAQEPFFIVPDSDDEDNDDGGLSTQRSQKSQIQQQNPVVDEIKEVQQERPDLQPSSLKSEESPRKRPHIESEAPLNGEQGLDLSPAISSQNKSSNEPKAPTMKNDSDESFEQLQARHRLLLQDLKILTAKYETEISDLLGKIAESSARLQKFPN